MKKEASLKSLLDKINLDVSKLYHIATHDEKTSLYNHSFFKDVFSFELDKARRGKPLSLIVIDIDFFKKINDSFGHLQADKILLKLAQLLQHQVRKYDVVARFGGRILDYASKHKNSKSKTHRRAPEKICPIRKLSQKI